MIFFEAIIIFVNKFNPFLKKQQNKIILSRKKHFIIHFIFSFQQIQQSLMSALSSKQSSKGNVAISFNNNEPKSSHRNAVRNDKTASKYSSSALSNKNQAMQITFQKTGQKLKKNLSKQFQTFNINNQDKLLTQNKSDLKSNKKHENSQQMTKSKTHAQMTTQAKSLLMKSNLSSKSKLSHHQQQQQLKKYEISDTKKRNKQQQRKSQQRSNRSKSPLSQMNRSRKSSPQVSPSYSKQSLSSMSKRVFSKGKLSQKSINKKNNNIVLQNINNSNNNQQGQYQKSSFMKQKKNTTTERKSKTQRNDLQINFPHLITESQSIYPSSSYPNTGPNTGKLSQNHQNPNYTSKEQGNNKMYIAQEQQSEFLQNQQQTQEDYISEQEQDRLYQMNYQNLGISDTYESKQLQTQIFHQTKDNHKLLAPTGYQQLPLSYITAMEILQKKVQQHEKTISKLNKQIKTKDNQYSQLQSHVKVLQSQLENRQEIIIEKQNEIKFLKGYLNQEKINNRQALKQIAKNVYERSISAKKNIRVKSKQMDNGVDTSVGKQKRKLFQASPIKDNQQKIIQLQQSQKKSQPDFIQKLIGPQQIHQMNLLQQSQQRQKLLKQQLQKQQLIKDQMMRQQILRQQALLKKQNYQKKKYQYLEQDNIENSKVQRRQELARSHSRIKKDYEDNNNFVSEMKRVRSVSTAIKPTQEKHAGNTIQRQRNVSVNQSMPYYADQNISHRKVSYQNTPIKINEPLKDPILEKYIQAKSQISPHPYSYTYNLTASKQSKQLQNNFFQGGENLKSEKKNRDTVSKMRQLMRAEKELIALNYKLQAFEKKILNTVQSTSGHDSNRIAKSQQQKLTESILLEQLQKQYSLMKKQFQKKELQVKELKSNLERQP